MFVIPGVHDDRCENGDWKPQETVHTCNYSQCSGIVFLRQQLI
jgi:hypothetical protein